MAKDLQREKRLIKNLWMQTTHKTDAEKLTQIASSLAAIAERLRGKTANISEETRSRVKEYEAAEICLWCRKHKPNERFTRGLCATHYNTVAKKIATGELDEIELLELGRIAESQPRGKKAENKVTAESLSPLPPLPTRGGKHDPSAPFIDIGEGDDEPPKKDRKGKAKK